MMTTCFICQDGTVSYTDLLMSTYVFFDDIISITPLSYRYPCRWGGLVDGKPLVAGLESFGSRALNNLWNAIQKHFPDEVCMKYSLLVLLPLWHLSKTCFTHIIMLWINFIQIFSYQYFKYFRTNGRPFVLKCAAKILKIDWQMKYLHAELILNRELCMGNL